MWKGLSLVNYADYLSLAYNRLQIAMHVSQAWGVSFSTENYGMTLCLQKVGDIVEVVCSFAGRVKTPAGKSILLGVGGLDTPNPIASAAW